MCVSVYFLLIFAGSVFGRRLCTRFESHPKFIYSHLFSLTVELFVCSLLGFCQMRKIPTNVLVFRWIKSASVVHSVTLLFTVKFNNRFECCFARIELKFCNLSKRQLKHLKFIFWTHIRLNEFEFRYKVHTVFIFKFAMWFKEQNQKHWFIFKNRLKLNNLL